MSEQKVNFGAIGMNLEQSLMQLQKGKLTYALNATVEGFDGQYVNYQNEQGNVSCVVIPEGYKVIGIYTIYEVNRIFYFLTNTSTGDSEIGSSAIDGCTYSKIINAKCLNFHVDFPILSAAHRADNCSLQIFWVDGRNKDRFIDLNNLPFKETVGSDLCENEVLPEIDCNKLSINPLFSIPQLTLSEVDGDGTLTSGTYQFGIQYANSIGEPYTSVFSITNPTPVFDQNILTLNFDSSVNRSIKIVISDIDTTGYYDYYNLVVVKTVNNISSAELIGTFFIKEKQESFIYTGQKITDLSIAEVFQKYPIYEISQDLTTANDVLIRDQLTSAERLSYQEIASKVSVLWQTYKLTREYSYKNELVAANVKGYMRDEVYALGLVFLLKDGRQTDEFTIPGRLAKPFDLEIISGKDVVDGNLDVCEDQEPLPRWKVYNTGSVLDFDNSYKNVGDKESCYIGPYQYGEMSYWESEEEYPCNKEIWGELAGQKIRHHKFPDSVITHIHDANENIYPIGIRIDLEEIKSLVAQSSLTQEQKDAIVGFKVVRGNRANNKSVIAKGLLHNVGQYTTNDSTYFYPNYPYNDRRADPFLANSDRAITSDFFEDQPPAAGSCQSWSVTSCCETVTIGYTDCAGEEKEIIAYAGKANSICSIVRPYVTQGEGNVSITKTESDICNSEGAGEQVFDAESLNAFNSDGSKKRFVFHSPDTHFFQPFLGNILKLETAEYGDSKGHFVQTKDHAKYKLYNATLYGVALTGAIAMGIVSRIVGVASTIFDGTAFMTTYKSLVDILERVTPKINYAYHYSSIGDYYDFVAIKNEGNKQRALDISVYLNPGMAAVGDEHPVNNFQRESSVYLKTRDTLPFTDQVGAPQDTSRWLPECGNLAVTKREPISSYYGSIKKANPSQYGQILSYETVDTGYQYKLSSESRFLDIFGGDIFINRFAYKSKIPYFIDNRVNAPDGSDVFYNEIPNVGIPKFWFSLDSTKGGSGFNVFGTPVANLHCQDNKFFYKRGRMYLFSYGIPNFFCESEVNVDYRQAFNNKEGDFYPRVSSDIPDQWLQESFVSINFDNTYYYNKTYSKQNKENFFSRLPVDFTKDACRTVFPYRAVFSEPRTNDPQTGQRNNWLIFKPASYFDFPQSYGKLIALDGIEYKQVLARFENKTQIYNALLTAPTSQASIYLGQSLFSQQVPPIDLADTDMGYIGARHRFILKTEYGKVVVDDKRGHVFLINGQQATNLVPVESGVEQFFNKNLEIQLVKYFPTVPIDNHFNGVGIHGVYDAKYNRMILTKLDFVPLVTGITYSNGVFKYGNQTVELTDSFYFCNKSFTISFDFDTKSWISFHSYLPNYYVGSNNFFISGISGKSWVHSEEAPFNNFYSKIAPYIIEYPYAFEKQDEILQSVSDYSKVFKYIEGDFIEVDDSYFNKLILSNNQQCSGILELEPKPKNNMKEYMKYPVYKTDRKTVTYTKTDNLYNVNQFWSLVRDPKQPIFNKTCSALSFDKDLNQDNMNYSKMAFKKAPLRAKDLKCRYILDNRDDIRIVSQMNIIQTQKSFL